MHRGYHTHCKLAIALLLLTAQAVWISAAENSALPAAGPIHFDNDEVEAFVERFFAEQLGPLHVPGASFALVKDAELAFAQGYGLADIEKQTPVVAERTLFDVQSIAKLFTVNAVMQAAERGIVHLDDDVNKHLKTFQVDNAFPEPIRLFHLVTHTSGLEDHGVGITARRESEVTPLGEYLARSLPPRVRPAGRALVYSDCGICLAGYVVESATSMPLAQFVASNVFEPLEMNRTHFLKLPPPLEPDLAMGYSYENGRFVALPHHYHNIWPSSSLMTTATDMAHFMIAHLQDGRYQQTRILREDTARQMHCRQFSHHAKLPGVCFDFFERFENGQRVIEHTGSGSGFVSELLLVPGHQLGYFLAINSSDPRLLNDFRDKFFEQLFPGQRPRAAAPLGAHLRSSTAELAGWYWFNRYDRRTLEKLASLVNGYARVRANLDGTLSVDGRDYVEVEPLLFRGVGDPQPSIAFRSSEDGGDDYLFLDGSPYQRVPWYDAPPFYLGLLTVTVLAFLSACMAWPIRAIARRWRRHDSSPQSIAARLIWPWAGVTSAVNLAALGVIALTLARTELPSVANEFQTGLPWTLVATISVARACAALSLALPCLVTWGWIRGLWSWPARVHFSILSMATISYIWFCIAWNLIPVRF